MTLKLQHHDSPVGDLRIVAGDDGLAAILWWNDTERVPLVREATEGEHPVIDATIAQLDAYFADPTVEFTMPLDLRGTDFQIAAWRALAEIPVGQTTTYGALAAKLGRPNGARAVGAAVGKNPASIVLPCHRVVGADGSLTGFSQRSSVDQTGRGPSVRRWARTLHRSCCLATVSSVPTVHSPDSPAA